MSKNTLDLNGAAKVLNALVKVEVIDASLKALKLEVKTKDQLEKLAILIKSSGVNNQATMAALGITLTRNSGAVLKADELTAFLKAAFPEAQVGERHGPHYLCLARCGKLQGIAKVAIPFADRKPRDGKAKAEVNANLAALQVK
jgi:hypothetical protein